MTAYLLKSPRHLVQYIATNLLPKKYVFYSTSWLPDGTDAALVDAKLLLKYDAHLSKEQQYRRSKAGFAKVKYLRCGQLLMLFATKGNSPFFEQENFKKITKEPLHIAGYALKADDQTGKVSVRLHKEAQRQLRREWLDDVKQDARWWESKIREFPFLPFSGVRDGLFALIRDLNESRKLLRKPPIDWKRCVRKKFTPEPVFDETPKEIVQLLEYYRRR